ncbi:MAG TPA: pantoate--beta-alanine ligase [Candidatus Acidoferrales bacterium]|nr:pantoate--beta-alanine ligase [Candidatus Acidoferrales bacterium]
MEIIESIDRMRVWSERERRAGGRIALVPTMGFLHEGHLRLVRDARRRGDRLVVSIFVNPKQFSPAEDYAGYPRDLERDRKLLGREGVDALFCPAAAEMYPEGYQSYVEVTELSAPLCGRARPGHFRGVATVVTKLFNIVRPHVAVFGEKDFQQLQIVRRLVRDLNFDIEIVGHPTVRDEDGLALSSRNSYLDENERRAALCLHRALELAGVLVRRGERNGESLLAAVRSEIAREPRARLDYAELCDPETLQPVGEVNGAALLALAVWIGKARLIDNVILRRGER